MRLADYLSANKLSAAEFAARIGVHRSTVSRWLEPVREGGEVFRPSWDLLAKIRDATDGVVTANDFVDVVAAADAPVASGADLGRETSGP